MSAARTGLRRLARTSFALALVAMLGGGVAIGYAFVRAGSPWIDVGGVPPSAEPVVHVAEHDVYIVRAFGEIFAIEDGRAVGGFRDVVEYCTSSRWLESPVTGVKFDRFGRYKFGPGHRNLRAFVVRVDDGRVLIDPTRELSEAARAAVPVQEKEGAFCV